MCAKFGCGPTVVSKKNGGGGGGGTDRQTKKTAALYSRLYVPLDILVYFILVRSVSNLSCCRILLPNPGSMEAIFAQSCCIWGGGYIYTGVCIFHRFVCSFNDVRPMLLRQNTGRINVVRSTICMTEYLETWLKGLEERVTRTSRPKTQFTIVQKGAREWHSKCKDNVE